MPTTFNSREVTAKPKDPMFSVGKKLRTVKSSFSITAAASANGDTFILAGPLTYADRIARIVTPNASPALTSAADNDLGFYTKDATGALKELDKDILWDGVTLASSYTAGRDLLYGLNSSLDATKSIGELLGKGDDQEPANGVFLVLTTNTANSATGPLILELDTYIEEPSTRA